MYSDLSSLMSSINRRLLPKKVIFQNLHSECMGCVLKKLCVNNNNNKDLSMKEKKKKLVSLKGRELRAREIPTCQAKLFFLQGY